MKPTAPPQNPVSDAHVAQFEEFIHKWRALLNLRDWRVVRLKRKRSKHLAEVVSIEHEHKLATYSIGTDFGNTEVTMQSLESTAIHELLHILLAPMIASAIAEGEDNDVVLEYEHAAIIVLEELLMQAYGERDAGHTEGK